MFEKVAEFHKVFNQLVSEEPALPEQPVRDLRRRLLLEELNEFCEAYRNDDLIEMADGLADMCYVIAGTCVSYGIAPKGAYRSPFDSMARHDVFVHTRLDRLLTDIVGFYEKSEEADDLEGVRKWLMALMMFIFGVALHLGIPINKVFDEVHRSNMSKLGPDGRPHYREDGKLLKGSSFSPPDIRSILFPVNSPRQIE